MRLRPGLAVRAAALVGLLLAVSVPARAAEYSCEGFAPVSTSCTTGSRVRTGSLSQDVNADFNYVGTIETLLVWGNQARSFRCTYSRAAERTCFASGSFPPVTERFTHRCRSLVPGTVGTVTPGVALPGAEGGAGMWQCTVTVG